MTVPLAARLDALRSLAEVAPSALPFGMNSIVVTPDGVLGVIKPPRPAKLRFAVNGLMIQAAVSPDADGDGSVCQIWAEVGHIPFTAQSPERRRTLLQILRGIKGLRYASFVVQQSQTILVLSERRTENPATPEDLAHQTVLMLHEARPFLRLLAEHL